MGIGEKGSGSRIPRAFIGRAPCRGEADARARVGLVPHETGRRRDASLCLGLQHSQGSCHQRPEGTCWRPERKSARSTLGDDIQNLLGFPRRSGTKYHHKRWLELGETTIKPPEQGTQREKEKIMPLANQNFKIHAEFSR